MKTSGRSLLQPWLLGGLLAGFAALHLSFLASHRERTRPVTSLLTWGCLAAAVTLMSLRPPSIAGAAGVLVLALGLGSAAARPFAAPPPTTAATDGDEALRGLRWLAWVEGASLLLMVVGMPLRRAIGFSFDQGTGTLAWVHGVLTVLFVQALVSTRRLWGWPRSVLAQGILSTLIPFGAFWFERHLRRRAAARREALDPGTGPQRGMSRARSSSARPSRAVSAS